MALYMEGPSIRKYIEKALQDLPALPDVVSRILQECEKEHTTAQQIERLACSDQALVAKILRIVNSSYYGLSGRISSLSQAVVILGMQQIRNLVLSMSALSMLKGRTPRQREILKSFWIHAFATGTGAQLIIRKKGLSASEAEDAFIGGLLHDIGKLFLFSNFTDTYQEVVRVADARGLSLNQAEAAVLGMSHEEVGSELARIWKYPEKLMFLIARHEGPFAGEASPALYAVHLADFITKHLYTGEMREQNCVVDPAALAWLDFSDEDFEELRAQIEQGVADAAALYGVVM